MTHELVISYAKSNILPFIRVLSGMYKLNETHIKVLTAIIYLCKQNNSSIITPEIKKEVTNMLKISNIYMHLKVFKDKKLLVYEGKTNNLIIAEPFSLLLNEEDLQLTFIFKKHAKN